MQFVAKKTRVFDLLSDEAKRAKLNSLYQTTHPSNSALIKFQPSHRLYPKCVASHLHNDILFGRRFFSSSLALSALWNTPLSYF